MSSFPTKRSHRCGRDHTVVFFQYTHEDPGSDTCLSEELGASAEGALDSHDGSEIRQLWALLGLQTAQDFAYTLPRQTGPWRLIPKPSDFSANPSDEVSTIASSQRRFLTQREHQSPRSPSVMASPVPQLSPPEPKSPDLSLNTDASDRRRRRLLADLETLSALQSDVTRLRVHVQQKRAGLRIARERVSAVDRKFMDALRHNWPDGVFPQDHYLTDLYEECRDARDTLGPIEDEYNHLDLKLGSKEYEVDEKIKTLAEKYNFGQGQNGHYAHSALETESSDIEFEPAPMTLPNVMSFHSDIDNGEDAFPQDHHARPGVRFDDIYGGAVEVGELPRMSPSVPDEVLGNSPGHAGNHPVSTPPHTSVYLASRAMLPKFDNDGLRFSAPDLECQPNRRSSHYSQEGFGLNKFGLDWYSDFVELHDNGADLASDMQDIRMLGHDDLYLTGADSTNRSILSDYILNFRDTHDRVNKWLLYNLRTSDWQIFQLRKHVELEARPSQPNINWTSSALSLWGSDDAAHAHQPEEEPAEGLTSAVSSAASAEDEILQSSESSPSFLQKPHSKLGTRLQTVE